MLASSSCAATISETLGSGVGDLRDAILRRRERRAQEPQSSAG